mmetsp:Transcript_32688/g.90236  ORF Transcript_32688/g.90236 Transcript_32688/m.90236 type:complete len:235 (-) Transcript_32688:604-1308(-)
MAFSTGPPTSLPTPCASHHLPPRGPALLPPLPVRGRALPVRSGCAAPCAPGRGRASTAGGECSPMQMLLRRCGASNPCPLPALAVALDRPRWMAAVPSPLCASGRRPATDKRSSGQQWPPPPPRPAARSAGGPTPLPAAPPARPRSPAPRVPAAPPAAAGGSAPGCAAAARWRPECPQVSSGSRRARPCKSAPTADCGRSSSGRRAPQLQRETSHGAPLQSRRRAELEEPRRCS